MSGITLNTEYPFGEKWDPVFFAGVLSDIVLNGILGSELETGTITSDQLGADCVITSKILAGAITTDEIAALTIVAGNIAAGAISSTKIASNSIIADHIQTDAITTTKLQAGSVIASKLSVTELSSISANLGTVSAGTLTAATLQTSANPTISRVKISGDGLMGYSATYGQVFNIPTSGAAPTFANGIIQSATIIDTTIVSNDFKTSVTLPYIALSDAGLSCVETSAIGLYNEFVYGDGTKYGPGVTAYLLKSDRPLLSAEIDRVEYADLRLANKSAVPTGACLVGDVTVINSVLKLCTGAGTGVGATWSSVAITGLVGTKVYYVADSSEGTVTRKLTFTNGILTSET